MNKMFCVSCGFKILYEVSKPKFCSKCGHNLAGISKAKEAEEPEEESSIDSIDVEKLKRNISVDYNSAKTTLKDIIANSSAADANPEYESRPASTNAEGDALLKQIQQECASSRMKDVDE
jgi:hypothetical protein